MRRKTLELPSPTLVVGIVALAAAVAGTAVAGPTATTSIGKKATKKLAKKQARKQVQKLAPGLSVRNAELLSGLGAEELSSSGYADRGDETIDLPGSPTRILDTQITTSVRGRVLASATLSLRGDTPAPSPDERATCSIRIAGTGGQSIEANAPPTSPRRFVISASFARQLDPGTHDVALFCTKLAGDIQARQGSLLAWTG